MKHKIPSGQDVDWNTLSLTRKLTPIFLIVCLVLLLFPLFPIPSQSQAQAKDSATVVFTGAPIQFVETSDYIRLNFTMFIIEFYKSGYEMLYHRNGSLLIEEHNMILQYYNEKRSEWTQCGDFTGLSWIKINDYHYQIIKNYTDYEGTNYAVIYDIRSGSRIKITINVESGAERQYRLHWSLDGIVYDDWKEKKTDNIKYRLVFGNESKTYGWVAVDWQDVYEQFKADIASYTIGTSAKGRKADVYLTFPEVLGAGEHLTIDPSLVSSSGGVGQPWQRQTFYAKGRFWVFYHDGSNMVYKTSTDGSTWSSATTVSSTPSSANNFGIHYDGNYVYYVVSTTNVYVRTGVPQTDGSINWITSETEIYSSSYTQKYPSIVTDSEGYIWVATTDPGRHYIRVWRSSNNDGTWGGASISKSFSGANSNVAGAELVALPDGEMAVVWEDGNGNIKCSYYDGSSWSTTTLASSRKRPLSAVYHDGLIYVLVVSTSYDDYFFYSFNYTDQQTTNLPEPSEMSFSADVYDFLPCLSVDSDNGKIYAFWSDVENGNYLYYASYDVATGTWSSTTSIPESIPATTGLDAYGSSFRTKMGGKIGLVYKTTNGIKFLYLNINQPPTNDACDSDAYFDVNVYGWINVTVSDPDGVDNLDNVQIKVTTSDSKYFTLKWTQSTNSFSEISDPDGICTLDASGSTRINIDSDTDKICFRFKISVAAQKGSCSVQVTTTDDSGEQDVDTYTDEFTINFYIEITVVDSTHGWSGLSPRDTDVLLTNPSDGDIDLTVSANGAFTIQAKGSGDLADGNGHTIPLANIKIHASDLTSAVSLSTTWQNIGGLTNHARGVSLNLSFKLWITVPNNLPPGTYTYTLYVQGIEAS